uniref:Uncharacterized protein n=1 Tax=Sinocyclocheilus grahami TaxID=75366 RepID=A0A672RKE4_SINGR
VKSSKEQNIVQAKKTLGRAIVTKTGASSDSPKDTGIVIEGAKVVTGLENVPRACCVLHGLTYVFQKPFLELDASKLSNRLQSLRSKLLS